MVALYFMKILPLKENITEIQPISTFYNIEITFVNMLSLLGINGITLNTNDIIHLINIIIMLIILCCFLSSSMTCSNI